MNPFQKAAQNFCASSRCKPFASGDPYMFKRAFKGLIGSNFLIGLAGLSALALAGNVLALSPEFNKPGHVLIADQFNNRVIEADENGNIVWSFGLGPNDFSQQSVIGVNDAQRVRQLTLMAGTGTAAGHVPPGPNSHR